MTDTDAAQAAQQARPAPDDQPDGTAPGMSVATQETGPFGIGKCKHCGTYFHKNKKKHEHCSDTCRYAEYDKRNPRISKVPKRRSLSGHQSARSKSNEWLTPPEILHALGRFDLDPCAPMVRPWDMAAKHYTVQDDGLSLPWEGRVWLNPPFGREAVKWLRRMRDHGNGIALIPARTETAMFYETVWGVADGVLFINGRPHFHYIDGRRADFNSGAPIVLVAYGILNKISLENSGLGFVVNAK